MQAVPSHEDREAVLGRKLSGLIFHTRMYVRALTPLTDQRYNIQCAIPYGRYTEEDIVAVNDKIAALTEKFQQFINAAHQDPTCVLKPWHYIVVMHMVDSEKVQAIKVTRQYTEMGLKESKDTIDCLQAKMVAAKKSKCNPYDATGIVLHYDYQQDALACLELAAGV